jgi:23S rRNA (uracil1939-C5)-methyltransferase
VQIEKFDTSSIPTNLLTPINNQELVVTVDSLSHGGSGVCRQNEFVIFVPNTCPGDKVRVRIINVKKNYAEADLLEVIEPSPKRIIPPCPVFGECGGCQWQHVEYPEQLKQKQLIVEHALSRIGKEEQVKILPIIASADQFHYRNRAQFRSEGPTVGFYKKGTHQIVEFQKCLIVEEDINLELTKIKKELEGKENFHSTKFEVYKTENGGLIRSLNRAHGEEMGFSQVNTAQNIKMQKYINSLLGVPEKIDNDNVGEKGNLLDLYCGNGNFSFALNDLGWRIYGIDASRQAITTARKRANPSTFFSVSDVSWEVKKLAEKSRKFEAILLDPPRIGAADHLWPNLVKLNAEKIIYVSCNPATFARDWARVKAKSQYRLESIQPFDMFPQTFHVELVALARK